MDNLATLTGFCVGFLSKKDFGCSIPPSSDIISHGDIVMLKLGNISSSEAKVTDFEVAVLIDKDILGFLDMNEISLPNLYVAGQLNGCISCLSKSSR